MSAPADRRSLTETPTRVRMYRQGLGDCFLITLGDPERASAKPFHLLIDCGVALGTRGARATMMSIARDIAGATQGRLDVVVATHEHWDHVSGFLQAREVFDRMQIDEVWLPWTMDETDAKAAERRRQRGQALRGLRVLAGRLEATGGSAAVREAHRLRRLLALAGRASGPSPREAVWSLVSHRSAPRVRYLAAGTPPIALTPASEAHAYVLGPARVERPATTKAPHVHFGVAALGTSLLAAVGADDDPELPEQSQAFGERYRTTAERAKHVSFFRERYFSSAEGWRGIDAVWLDAASTLALAVDVSENNASLALALELAPGGAVLLFPGDTQSAAWHRWWPEWSADGASRGAVTTADLLRRTVLYKVSHHGSSSGTPCEGGLELMSDQALTAMISVGATCEGEPGWDMPSPALLRDLHNKARGRLLRSDKDWAPTRSTEFGTKVVSSAFHHDLFL